MKKLKLILTSAAIILAVAGAFALRDNKQSSTTLPSSYPDSASARSATGHPCIDSTAHN